MSTQPKKTPADLTQALYTAAFVGFRWESPFTPCTGITAVFKQERAHFAKQGVFIAPWCPRMAAAQKALADGKVVEVEGAWFEIYLQKPVQVKVLMSTDAGAPIFFLHVVGDDRAFAGVQTPYDTPYGKRDCLLFALAAEQILARYQPAGHSSLPFAWAADWQCVPAMMRLHWNRVTCLHLHNLYDEYLGDEARALAYDHAAALEGRSVLSAGFASADVVATVSRGFAEGIRREILHTAIFAPHLQPEAHRIESVENANFVEMDAHVVKLADALSENLEQGAKLLAASKQAAREKLPPELREKVKGKTLIVSMGRSATQKLHCTVVEAAARLLQTRLGASAFFVFASTNGDRDDEVRQDTIAAFAARHPESAAAFSGRIPFFGELMLAADLNVMASLWEPFGGAYEGTVLPVARAIDGLASQIRPFRPTPFVAGTVPQDGGAPTGWLFRELPQPTAEKDLEALLTSAVPSIRNATYAAMIDACSATLASAVELHQNEPLLFAELVRNALGMQRSRSWNSYDRMLELAAAARAQRRLP